MKRGPSVEQFPLAELKKLIARDFSLDARQQKIMDDCLRESFDIWTGLYDDVVGCVYGVIHPTMLSNRAYFWLFTNDKMVLEHQFTFIRGSQIVIQELLTRYDSIHGEVETKYPRAKRWLGWLGAKFTHREELNAPLQFEIRRK